MTFLVTGATGNVGQEVLRHLRAAGHPVVAGTRDGRFGADPDVSAARVDFETGCGPDGPFEGIFLMRPPQLADPAPFARFLDRFARDTLIVFLSVEGAGNRPWLPHAKIEKTVSDMGFRHVFVRPCYFMDNLTTTLWPVLREERRIYLPAGGLRLGWISARDVGAVCAALMAQGRARDAVAACSGLRAGFAEVCDRINAVAGTRVSYHPAGLFPHLAHARRRGLSWGFIAVMLLLHFLPRFRPGRADPADDIGALLGRDPESLEDFVRRNLARFQSLK